MEGGVDQSCLTHVITDFESLEIASDIGRGPYYQVFFLHSTGNATRTSDKIAIRNSKTKMATAARGLDAQRRWVR